MPVTSHSLDMITENVPRHCQVSPGGLIHPQLRSTVLGLAAGLWAHGMAAASISPCECAGGRCSMYLKALTVCQPCARQRVQGELINKPSVIVFQKVCLRLIPFQTADLNFQISITDAFLPAICFLWSHRIRGWIPVLFLIGCVIWVDLLNFFHSFSSL